MLIATLVWIAVAAVLASFAPMLASNTRDKVLSIAAAFPVLDLIVIVCTLLVLSVRYLTRMGTRGSRGMT